MNSVAELRGERLLGIAPVYIWREPTAAQGGKPVLDIPVVAVVVKPVKPSIR